LNWFMRYIVLCIICHIGFSSAYGAELQIKPGNLVHITVLGYPELSQKVMVRQDGTTDYALLANIPIDGMTVHSLHEFLQPILVRFIERPKLFINIDEHRQIEVTVEGQVRVPGTHTVREAISLQGVFSIAGGTSKNADLKNITINRQEFESYREITVDLYKFYADRENASLPDIQDGDIIFVPLITSSSMIKVMGAVRSPGLFRFVEGDNIADLINSAGGAMPNGKMNRIIYFAYRDGKHRKQYIKLNQLLFKGLPDQIPLVYAGDIIVVTEYKWYEEVSWYISLMRDATLVLSSIIILSRL